MELHFIGQKTWRGLARAKHLEPLDHRSLHSLSESEVAPLTESDSPPLVLQTSSDFGNGAAGLGVAFEDSCFSATARSSRLWKKLGCFKSSRPECCAMAGITLNGEKEQKRAAS